MRQKLEVLDNILGGSLSWHLLGIYGLGEFTGNLRIEHCMAQINWK
jgi:hypothetical protein